MEGQEQAQILLHPLQDDLAAEYFQELAGSHDHCVEVRLRVGGNKGKGVVALKDLHAEDLVFREAPLVGAQHTANRRDALVCSHCFALVGSLEQQIAHRLLARAGTGLNGINPDYLRSLWSGAGFLPYSDRFPLPSLVHCLGGCTDNVYCSEACAQADWQAHHALLCCGPLVSSPEPQPAPEPLPSPTASSVARARTSFDAFRDAQMHMPLPGLQSATPPVQQEPRNLARAEALRAFRAHADETNDIFHLAAQVIAGTILRAEALLGSDAAQATNGHADGGRACWAALQRAWRPFAAAWKAPWWECVAVPEDVSDGAAFRQDLCELAGESLALLREAAFDARFPALFSPDVYGAIIGMFELNNLSLYVASPVEDYFLSLHLECEDSGLSSGEQNLAQLVTKPLLDAVGDSYDAGCEGSAFYALQSCLNHSCAPNAHAFKRDGCDTDGAAVILAKRDIRAGEEVCVSYIDESQPLNERQAALRDYGFTCACEKCSAESAAAGKGKSVAR